MSRLALSPCEVLPGPARPLCEVPVSGVTDAAAGVVADASSSVFDAAANAIAQSASYFVGRLGELVTATTTIDVSAPWFLRQYALMFGLSAFLTLALLILTVLKEVARGQWSAALRAGTVYYLAAVIASAFAPAVVYLLLQLSDGLCAALVAGSGQTTDAFFSGLGATLTRVVVTSPQVGPFTLVVAGLGIVGCAVVLWVELLLRAAIVYVALLFAAPTFSGLVDRSLWRHSRKWLHFMVSVIFAKPVVVAVLLLGAAATGSGSGSTQDSVGALFVGIALLLVSVFAVALLFRLVPNAGDQLAGVLSARRELKAATPSLPLPSPSGVLRQSVQSHLLSGARARSAPRPSVPTGSSSTGVHRVSAPAPGRTPAPAGGST